MRLHMFLLAAALVLGGCGSASHDEPSHTSPLRAAASSSPAPAQTALTAANERTEAKRPALVRYDLGAAADHAELRQDGACIVDFGTPGAAKYTLGGWRTHVEPARLGGRPVALVTDTRGTVYLPWYGQGDAVLTLRARAMARGPIALQLNGQDLDSVDWPRDAASTLHFRVPPSAIHRGDNELTIRSLHLGRAPDGSTASAALDWIRLGPASDARRDDAPPAPGSMFGRTSSGVPLVRLTGGWTLAWSMQVPAGARLRGVAQGPGTVVARVRRADGTLHALGTVAGHPFDWDLGAMKGQVISLELSASGGDAVVLRPSVVTPAPQVSPERRRPRNVLIYLVDTLRSDHLEPYNPHTRVKTPGVLRFVKSATTFLDARSQENWTKPSVATLLSSLMPWVHTATKGDSVLPASVQILPEMLKAHGFYTGSFIANGYVSDKFGFDQGWNTYRNYIRENRRSAAEYVAADALDWLDRRPKNKPFFLYVHTIDPHVPYRPPVKFLGMYGPTDYRGPVNFHRDALVLEKIKLGKMHVGPRDKAHLKALYDGEITYNDVHFSEILDGLERRGLADDTLVVFTSDHGEEFWDHGSVGHGHSVYDELLHVPLSMRIPGLTDGAMVHGNVGLVDVVPTILDALGLPIPDQLEGRSLLGMIEGKGAPAAPKGTITGFLDNWRALTVGRSKLLQRGTAEGRLYDLHDDPHETRDVSAERPVELRLARGLMGLALARTEPAAAQAPRTPHGRAPRARRHAPPAIHQQTVVIDEATRAQLRALGYVQ